MSSLGERLKEARERKGLKQTQVKDKTGINNKTLSGYENGVSEPDIETLKTLANLYEVTLEWIVGESTKGTELVQAYLDRNQKTHSTRDIKDLRKFLETQEIMFDGVPLTDEDKKRIEDVLTGLFWEAKQMNKRKKTDDK